ncbi:unnamed protein product [Ranitomeya imitator]|uniref:Uncharacterized protein n=1 Tax=Ranitomeya imitator TaxID=111125 RepID=A0ABN9LZZ9_9NEOB|nr:unnamed protein product [Ranitomeya imitator]
MMNPVETLIIAERILITPRLHLDLFVKKMMRKNPMRLQIKNLYPAIFWTHQNRKTSPKMTVNSPCSTKVILRTVINQMVYGNDSRENTKKVFNWLFIVYHYKQEI